jgi:hypothetical protein
MITIKAPPDREEQPESLKRIAERDEMGVDGLSEA